MTPRDGFLTRWSKRKLATEALAGDKPEVEEAEISEPGTPEVEAKPPEAVSEPEFDISTLPPIESLTGASDLSAFMQKGVPEALKNAALRHAWALDPVIRDYRGPVDYAWDFNDPLAMPGFSPAPPEFDTTEMMRRIAGDPPPADENRDAGQAGSAGLSDPQPGLESGGSETADLSDAPPSFEAVDSPGIGGAADPQEPEPEVEALPGARRRRHGSALPA